MRHAGLRDHDGAAPGRGDMNRWPSPGRDLDSWFFGQGNWQCLFFRPRRRPCALDPMAAID
jgi:hypothetical protein